jgi:hypothetical protein
MSPLSGKDRIEVRQLALGLAIGRQDLHGAADIVEAARLFEGYLTGETDELLADDEVE